jgi:hypothetical protein
MEIVTLLEAGHPRPLTRKHGRPAGSRRAHDGPPAEVRISGADLTYPNPHIEARACLRVAKLNGGIVAMRELIRITPEEEWVLRRMAETGQLPMTMVWRAIEYRSAVLWEFDKLATADESNTTADITLAAAI